jgi:hypothetical protein
MPDLTDRQRLMRAPVNLNDGFSVVAPINWMCIVTIVQRECAEIGKSPGFGLSQCTVEKHPRIR